MIGRIVQERFSVVVQVLGQEKRWSTFRYCVVGKIVQTNKSRKVAILAVVHNIVRYFYNHCAKIEKLRVVGE